MIEFRTWMNTVATHPRRIAHYEVIEFLGSVGAVHLYRACDASSRRSVSLKVVSLEFPEGDVTTLLEEFRQQAQVCMKLKHPGIVEVFEFGEEGPLAYIASEFVEGCKLKPHMRVAPADAAILTIQLLEALEYAHGQGVTHFGLKPSRLILTSKGQLKVTDFGAAHVLTAAPAYLAPEQLDGSTLDKRVDVFAGGALFYEFLTGTSPFAGTQTIALQQAPSVANADQPQTNADLPPAFITICGKALESRPEDRYPSARAFCDAVRRAFQEAFGSPPPRVVSNETVVSIFLSTLRGDLRKRRAERGIRPVQVKAAAAPAKLGWDEQVLRRVARELGAFVGPLAMAIVKEAAEKTNDLDKLYDLAAESLATSEDRIAFLARRSGTAVRDARGEVPASKGTSYQEPRITPEMIPSPRVELDRSVDSQIEVAAKAAQPIPSRLEKASLEQMRPSSPIVSDPKPPRPVSPPVRIQERRSSPPDVSINERLEELFGKQPENLAGYLKQQPSELSDVIYAFVSATDALASRYAEKNRFVGLTPENICFDRVGKATIHASSSTALTGSTMDGAIGSPRYAAPEIFADGAGALPAAADVYTLGFMFYEIVLGTELFRTTFSGQRSDLDWLRWHADLKSKAPQLKQLLPAHPAALSDLLESMIAKESGKRLSDPKAVLFRLRSIAQQANKTIIAQKPLQPAKRPAPSARQPKKKNVSVKLIVLAVVLAGCVFLAWQNPQVWRKLKPILHHYLVPNSSETAGGPAAVRPNGCSHRDCWENRKGS